MRNIEDYTESYIMRTEDGVHEFAIMVKPETDLDGQFVALDMEHKHFIRVNGWTCFFEPLDQYRDMMETFEEVSELFA